MAKFINPFTDVGFKIIFGQEMTKDLLIDFLNDLLVGERHIQDITFLDKELQPEFQGDRGVIYDIYCTTDDGDHIIVEMQNRSRTGFVLSFSCHYTSGRTGSSVAVQPKSCIRCVLHEFPSG